MITFFALCGGAIGGMLLVLGLFARSRLMPPEYGPSVFADWAAALFGGLLFGAFAGSIVGFVPALVGGVIYAFLPGALQRIIVAAPVGAVISACWALISNSGNLFWEATLAGAASAAVCAAIARKFGIDHFRAGDGAPSAPPPAGDATKS